MKAGKLGQTTEDRQRESKVQLQQRKVSHTKKINPKYQIHMLCNI